jgi:hypothetical protein
VKIDASELPATRNFPGRSRPRAYKTRMEPSPRPPTRALALVLSVAGLLAIGCRPTYPTTFPLEWRGVDEIPRPSSPVAEGLRKHTLRIEAFLDKRVDPKRIGLVQEDRSAVKTSTDVAGYCTQKFGDLLTRAGAKIVTTGATITLRPELVVYEVIEGEVFNGDAVIRITALENDKVIYEGTHSGKSKRWGRSRNPENYNEALSNALLEATRDLLKDNLLAKALGATTIGGETTAI